VNITFTGPQCSGKTTLLKQMKQTRDIMDQYFYIDEVTRLVKKEFNVGINEEGANDITQLLIINKELENLFKYNYELWPGFKGVVHDRCLLDGLVFTEYFYEKKLVSQQVWSQALSYWMKFYTKYDIIFYPDPHEIPLVDDGERSINREFRNSIIEKYENYYLNQFQWKEKVHRLKGTVEERMAQIKIVLNEYNSR
jgi:nicotinamide riboside kinase